MNEASETIPFRPAHVKQEIKDVDARLDEWESDQDWYVFRYAGHSSRSTERVEYARIIGIWLQASAQLQYADDLALIIGLSEPSEAAFQKSYDIRRSISLAMNKGLLYQTFEPSFDARSNLLETPRRYKIGEDPMTAEDYAATAAALRRLDHRSLETVEEWAARLAGDLSQHTD